MLKTAERRQKREDLKEREDKTRETEMGIKCFCVDDCFQLWID